MRNLVFQALAVSLFTVAAVEASATAAQEVATGQRVVANFGPDEEPNYPPGSLHWNVRSYHAQPLVFRTVWSFPEAPTEAAVRVTAKDWLYLWVNGRCVGEFDPGRQGRGGASFPVQMDLAPHLRAGENVVAVSVSNEGFALAGFAKIGGALSPLASKAEEWRVWKFPPLTDLAGEPLLTRAKLGEDVKNAPCNEGEAGGVECTSAQARAIVDADLAARLTRQLGDIAHEANLLAGRGVVVLDDRTMVWGGPLNLPPAAVAAARQVAADCPKAAGMVESAVGANGAKTEAVKVAAEAVADLAARLGAAKQVIAQGNRLTYLRLARSALAMQTPLPPLDKQLDQALALLANGDAAVALSRLNDLAAALDGLEKNLREGPWAGPLNELNSAIANKAGWIDDPTLTDSIPEAWGVRCNPVETSWFLNLAGKWRFKLDPDNTGLTERVHEFGYNIENQWPELTVPGEWEKQGAQFQRNNPRAVQQSPFPGINVRTDGPYNGYAWYRQKVLVPAEWAGYDLELYMGSVDDWDWFYWNGEKLGETTAATNPRDWWHVNRHYRIPKEKVTFGGYNVIAVQVFDCGAGGGILGGIELRCPALKESFENKPPAGRKRTDVLSSALSPAALLTVGESQLEMFGWDLRSSAGPEGLLLTVNGQSVYRAFEDINESAVVYDAATDGPLTANWVLLWAQPGRADGELPIELVLLAQPRRINVERGQLGTRRVAVDFGVAGQQVLALRPVRADSSASAPTDPDVIKACQFWSSAVLAYPVHYAELAKCPPGRRDQLEVIDAYEYRILRDAWGTEPVKIAPLPPLASFGLSVKARGLTVGPEVQDLGLSLGEYGQMRGVVGAETIRYTVPLDTLPRLGGFTAFCFGGGDVGVPGNGPEIRFIADTGANSWRPQSNDSGRRIFDTIDWANQAGLNLTLNIDGGLGARPDAIAFWETIARHCKDMPAWAVAYDLINEPANMTPEAYNPQIKRIVEAVRKIDTTHTLMVETPHSFASIDQFVNLAPVDDDKVMYVFHDYDFRLPDRWPRMNADVRNMAHQWLPAYKFALRHDAPICVSEFGGFEQGGDPWRNRSALVLLNDFFRVFDQFGFSHHYYSNRGVTQIRADGSYRPSLVQEAYRRLFAGDTFYRYRENWQQKR